MPDLSDSTIRNRVREVLVELAPVRNPPDKPDLALADDLGYTSLALLEAIVTLEDELGFFLTDDGSTDAITTVANIQDYVVKLAHAEE